MQKIERILVGFDFSPCSTLALQYGIDLAASVRAELDILFVEVLHGEAFNAASREKLEQLVEQQLRLRGHADVRVKKDVDRYFAAAPAIIERAAQTDADLIIVGTHGRRGLRALMLGSVAQEIVRHADIPVLTVRCKGQRESMAKGIGSILVPFDFSVHSRKALADAVEIAAIFDSSVRVLHVVEDRFHPAFYGPFFQSIYDLDPDIEDKTIAHLEQEIAPFRREGVEIITEAVRGYPGTEIPEYADRHEIDLIVMSTHGLTGLELLTLGSVAARTVSLANCPVLTLRREPLETEAAVDKLDEMEEVQ